MSGGTCSGFVMHIAPFHLSEGVCALSSQSDGSGVDGVVGDEVEF